MSVPRRLIKHGSLVRVRFEGDDVDTLVYLGSESDGAVINAWENTPIGQALLGYDGRGDVVKYESPRKGIMEAKVIEVIA